MRVLVIGAGGREHALCVALAADPVVSALSCAPGNGGTHALAPPPSGGSSLDVTDPAAIAELAVSYGADLVVVGPEVPLVAGAADAVRAAGIACFGPSGAAAALEGSKAFAKDVMQSAGVPTAQAISVTDRHALEDVLDQFGPPYVVKDDGLAAGKGVVVTDDRDVALTHGRAVLGAGSALIVEEFLDGPEVSLFAITDGRTVLPLLPAQDFKRIGDGDTGPNTGGMGAYCPLPWAPEDLVSEVTETVLRPTVEQLAQRGTPFTGLLYAGLALTRDGVRVIEFNARFGDPETQVVLPLLATPLATLLHAAATGTLEGQPPLAWSSGAAVTVVLAAPGYPGTPTTGEVVAGADDERVRHAGTTRDRDGTVRATGGRVLSVVGRGPDLIAARADAYDAMDRISLPGGQFRADIARAAADGEVRLPS